MPRFAALPACFPSQLGQTPFRNLHSQPPEDVRGLGSWSPPTSSTPSVLGRRENRVSGGVWQVLAPPPHEFKQCERGPRR